MHRNRAVMASRGRRDKVQVWEVAVVQNELAQRPKAQQEDAANATVPGTGRLPRQQVSGPLTKKKDDHVGVGCVHLPVMHPFHHGCLSNMGRHLKYRCTRQDGDTVLLWLWAPFHH